jgi:hypothetical protein
MTKFDELRAIAHNLADSFGSGIGLLIGAYTMDVYGEARSAPDGVVTVDFLAGTIAGGKPSPTLARAAAKYRDALPEFCDKHGAAASAFRELTARYAADELGRPGFVVTVVDREGRLSADRYVGTPGRRAKILDPLGRLRPEKPQPRS